MNLGNLIVIAAPSGGGKTSLVTAMLKNDPQLTVSVSHTTRAPRVGENHGVHYHFISKDRFEQLIAEKAFLEHATVFDHYYGTSKEYVKEQLATGKDVLLEIDWQGAAQVNKLFPEAITIFILPPSLKTLKERLIKRAQDNPDIIKRRLAEAQEEIAKYEMFKYLVVNDDFSTALNELESIIRVERLKVEKQKIRYKELIQGLLEK